MNIEQIKEKLKTEEYDFLRQDQRLGGHIILLTLGGSHAYGMDQAGSDLDVRGIAFNPKEEVLTATDFRQVVNAETDTTIYSFQKMIQLLTANNPNTLEILGCLPEHYLHLSEIGKELIENRKMFLSRICIHTFGGYAENQLRRMENKSTRLVDQAKREAHILKSIEHAAYEFKNRYYPYDDSDVKLYVDTAVQEGYDSEIFMDVCLKHYPLRDWAGIWSEMRSIIYRAEEHELLMSIRNSEFLDEKRQPTSAFYDLLNEYEKRFDYAKENTSLPDVPDHKRIREFQMYVNERIVKGEL